MPKAPDNIKNSNGFVSQGNLFFNLENSSELI